MWTKWLPWRYIVRHLARQQGFLDPFSVITKLSRFAQPSEVLAPAELLRASAVFHARGLMNSQAIQHNLDWVWPYWVCRQFDPYNAAFVPRAFSLTHVNLTHRNWTAVGLPDYSEYPLIDPRGLVTPFYDAWSLDFWIVSRNNSLIPSKLNEVQQNLIFDHGLCVETIASNEIHFLKSRVYVERDEQAFCKIDITASSHELADLVISVRPFNPEGVSFIHEIGLQPEKNGWKIENKTDVFLSEKGKFLFSNYKEGDVRDKLFGSAQTEHIKCEVGMATAAAVYPLKPQQKKIISIKIPLPAGKKTEKKVSVSAEDSWEQALEPGAQLKISDEKIKFLFDAAVRTLILHSPEDVYPGPYTYKHFWFRDAAFILDALLCLGFTDRVERCLDRFPKRQTPFGYFLSQQGEWDSNGEALWILNRFCQAMNRQPKEDWKKSAAHAAKWIVKKRLSDDLDKPHAGLLPAGFSAEHLGPNDFYYWDDFWCAAGLHSGAELMRLAKEGESAKHFDEEAGKLLKAIDKSLLPVQARLGHKAIPASPYRRMDTGSIGSLAGGYPLGLWEEKDERLLASVDYLLKNSFVNGGFFHDMSHSGMNPYLTLHVAQVFLRAGDLKFYEILKAVAELATPTGQWPEAIHPQTLGGCMGDGQHVWAAAEWILMIKNCFVREEKNKLILGSGLVEEWTKKELQLGPIFTSYGTVTVKCKPVSSGIELVWESKFHKKPIIEVRVPGFKPVEPKEGQTSVILSR